MALSVFDLYSVGIGPSSSHTVGPMRAAKLFADGLVADGLLDEVARVRAELYGSLGATGHGHGSEKAVILGLEGEEPATVDIATYDARATAIRDAGRLRLAGVHDVAFGSDDLVMHRRKSLPGHPNGMRFEAYDASGALLRERVYYSVGGGFVVDESAAGADRVVADETPVAHPFGTAAELLAVCAATGLRISDVMLANELSWRTEAEVRSGLLEIWSVMEACVRNGCAHEGVLPGGLKVPRRAPALHARLVAASGADDPLTAMDWVNLFALAVNEENAAGGRMVTAPTNGAAGIIPAVLHYYVAVRPRLRRRRHRAVPAHRRRDRRAVQGERLHLRRRGGLPGRGRLRLLDGGRRVLPRCWAARRSRSRTPPRSASSTTSASPATPSAAWSRSPASSATPSRRSRRSTRPGSPCAGTGRHTVSLDAGDQDDARHGPRHAHQVQGDLARRPRRQRDRVLTHGRDA